MHQLIVAATSQLKVLSIRDMRSGSAIGSEVNIQNHTCIEHIISGKDNDNHNVVQDTGTVN